MESHSEYMRRRAGEEMDAADRASSPKVRALHTELAARYRDAADGPPPPPVAGPALRRTEPLLSLRRYDPILPRTYHN